MKKILTSLIFSVSCFLVNAQQNRFIYLQTENGQPFFVKLENKILNSYPLGYLIIPKLDDGVYSLVIGFPESSNEQEFNCSIKNKDVGFIIKNAGEKQWQLLNLQTLNTILPGDIINKAAITYEKETDPFSTMLANAVHDSTILRKDVAKEIIPEKINEQIPKDSANTITSNNDVAISKQGNTVMSDSAPKDATVETLPEKTDKIHPKDSTAVIVLNTDAVFNKTDITLISDVAKTKTDSVQVAKIFSEKINEPKDTVLSINPNKDIALLKSVIKRKLKKANKEGLDMMYIDDNGNTKDTIRIFIPSDKKKQNEEIQTELVSLIQPLPQVDKAKDESDKNKMEPALPERGREIIKQPTKEPVFINSIMINSDCKNFATEEDFLKVRKKMVAENNDENMIKAAKKYFKTKCFTTEQIKNLSVLFLKDEGKYMFFDASYAFVSDTDLYYTLEKQLSDNYYITRFRAMIHK